jgi:hypothetical protein
MTAEMPEPENLAEVRALLEQSLAAVQPMSPAAHVVATMLRFVEIAEGMMQTDSGPPASRLIAQLLLARDVARSEQNWIQSVLRDETPGQSVLDALQHYHARLAQIEAQTMLAVAYVDTDREEPDGLWWASTAGRTIPQFMADMARMIDRFPGFDDRPAR